FLQDLKKVRRGRIDEMATNRDGVQFFEGVRAWDVACEIDIAMPCATQNELNGEDAQKLFNKKMKLVAEGANMPSTPEAVAFFHEHNIAFAPGKASNAGVVAASGLEMSRHSLRLNRPVEEVELRLRNIMKESHPPSVKFGRRDDGTIDAVTGANTAGFVKVAHALIDQGVV